MTREKLYILLDDLQLNLKMKRHRSLGLWDARIYHKWMHQCILSSCSKDSPEECLTDFVSRIRSIEEQRVQIEKVNQRRANMVTEQDKLEARAERSSWNDWE